MVESFVNILSLPVAQVYTKKVPVLGYLTPAKNCGISHKKALNMIHCMVSAQCCICNCLGSSGQMIVNCVKEDYHVMCTVVYYFPLRLGKAVSVH